jgi:hypothetical protein
MARGDFEKAHRRNQSAHASGAAGPLLAKEFVQADRQANVEDIEAGVSAYCHGEAHAPRYLKNIARIITETGLRVYKELMPMSKDQVDLRNTVVRIPDSKTPNGVAVFLSRHLPWKPSKIKWLVVDWVRFSFRVT